VEKTGDEVMALNHDRWRQASAAILFASLLLALWAAPSLSAYKVSGQVVDAETDQPVPNCLGYLKGDKLVFVSDANGRFSIEVSELPTFIKTRHVVYEELIYPLEDRADLEEEIVLRVVPHIFILEPVEVKESRFSIDPMSTPTPLSVISQEQISHQNPINVSDILKDVPGVELNKTGPWTSRPVIRGMGGDRVLVLVDGHRLNQPRGHGAQPSLVDIESVERIEVLRGSSSALYGSEAMGGVVNIITKSGSGDDLRSDFGGGLNLTGRTADEQIYGRLDLRGGRGPLSFEVGISGRSVGLLQTPAGVLPNSDFDDMSADAAVRLRAGDHHHFRLSLQAYRAKNIGIPAFSIDSQSSGRFPSKARNFFEVSYSLKDFRAWLPRVEARVYRQAIDSRFEQTSVDSMFFGSGMSRRFIGWRVLDEKRFSDLVTVGERVETNFTPTNYLLLTAGLESLEDEVGGPNTSHEVHLTPEGKVRHDGGVVDGAAMPDATRTMRSVFLQGELEGPPGFLFTLGGRYDWAKTKTFATEGSPVEAGESKDGRPSVKLGAKVDLTSYLALTGALGTGFKIPSLQERYYNGTVHGGLMLFGNPDLVSEKSLTADLGARLTFRSLEAKVDLFRTWADDLITVQYLTLLFGSPRFQYFNIDKAIIEGIETELTWRPHAFVQLGGTLSWLRGDDVSKAAYNEGDRTPLPSMPPIKCVLWLAYSRPTHWGPVTSMWVEPRVRIVDDRDRVAVNEPTSPGFTVYDLRLGARIASSHEITLAVENVANRLYSEPLSFIPEAGRNFILSLRTQF
jgi:TonB-dependent heme/hemoglobin receptor